jgi:c-di-GMP-binding flagellar brake protein YcgR
LSQPPTERRAHPRHAAELTLDASVEEGGVVARMITRDLSLGGVYCTSRADFPEMTRLAVRLMVPTGNNGDTRGLEIEAVVVRRREILEGNGGEPRYELGLYFTRMDDEARAEISRLIH